MAVAGRPSIRILVEVTADDAHGRGEATPVVRRLYVDARERRA
ncbi:hypothetical protein [Streptomyces sp. NPDC096153]